MSELISEELDVWVLAGQSNMQGWAPLEDVSAPDERVWCFTSAGHWEIATEPLHRLWENCLPTSEELARPDLPDDLREFWKNEAVAVKNFPRTIGAGLGISFGKTLADLTDRKIGLIATAYGGTTLDQWSHQLKQFGGASLYGAMLERIRRAGGNLRGVLWYQGESDANPQSSFTYEQRFTDWIADLRAEVGQPQLPVIVVQLGRFVTTPENVSSWEHLREVQAALPHKVPHVAVTSAIDLCLADPIHINTAGLIRLGPRLARLAVAMEAQPNEVVGPQIVAIKASGDNSITLSCKGVSGGWLPRHNMSGFEVRAANGSLHPALKIVDASAVVQEPTSVRLLLHGPVPSNIRVGYGLGYNPYCNVIDEADMPLCAFLPRPLD